MIKLKDDSVLLAGLQLEMDIAMRVVEKHLSSGMHLFKTETVITAGTEEFKPDGSLIHMVGSYHPRGYALDFRDWYIPTKQYDAVKAAIQEELREINPAYDVVKEGDHLHVEFDLRKDFLFRRG